MSDEILPEEMQAFAEGSVFWFAEVGIALPELCREGASQFYEASVAEVCNAQFRHAALANTEEIAGTP